MTLDEIAAKEGTDKSSLHHFYTKYYSMFFEELRDEPLAIMEIGVWKGESLKMWKKYFQNSQIYGIDYEDKSQYNEERIHTFIADQSVPEQLTRAVNQMQDLDIIIEDGSHQSTHQIMSFVTLFTSLKPGGYYVVEDCLTSYNYTFCKPNEMPFIEYAKGLVGAVQMDGKIIDLGSDKYKAVQKYEGSYMQKNIEWIWIGCGLVIIKKMK